MIEQPIRLTVAAQQTASIHLHIPVQAMAKEFPQALAEISTALAEQGVAPAGPVFAHHRRRPTDTFDFTVCIPVARPIAASGRVEPLSLPALLVLRTTYHGGYAELPHAWGEFIALVQADAPAPRGDFLEAYVVGPNDNANFASWRTELSIILTEAEEHRG